MADLTRPTGFADFYGQDEVKEELRIRIRSAQLGEQRLEHILLIAPPGAGKTSLAEIIGAELGEPTETLVMPVKERVLIDTVRAFDGCLVLDELQEAGRPLHHQLLTLVKDGWIQASSNKRIEAPWLTIIATTTDPQKILPALYDRFHVRPELRDYTNDELSVIVQSMGRKLGVEVPEAVAVAFGAASLGSPRRAKGIVVAYQDLTRTLQEEQGRAPTIDEAFALSHVDADGLSSQHVRYLEMLDTLGGTRGKDLVARLMRLHVDVVEDLERILILRGLVAVTDQGRELSKAGYQRLQKQGAQTDGNTARRR